MDTANEASVSAAQGELEAVGPAEEPSEAPLADALPEAPVQRDEDLPEAPVPVLEQPMTDSSTADSLHTAAHADTADVSQTAVLSSARPAETSQTADPQTAENTRTPADDKKTGDASTVPEAATTAGPAPMAVDQPVEGRPLADLRRRTVAIPRSRIAPGPSVPTPVKPTMFFTAPYVKYGTGAYGLMGEGVSTSSPVIGVSRVGVFPPSADEARDFHEVPFGDPTPFVAAPVPAEEPTAPEVFGMSESIWADQRKQERIPEAPAAAPAPPPTTLPATPAPKQPEAAAVYCRPKGTIPEVGGGPKKPRVRRRKAKGKKAEEGGAEEGTAEEPAAVEDPAPVVQEPEQQPVPVTGDAHAKYLARLAKKEERDALRAKRALERPAGGWPVGHAGWLQELRDAGTVITAEQWGMVERYHRAEIARQAAVGAATAKSAEQSVARPEETRAVAAPAAAVQAEGARRNATPPSLRRSPRLAANAAREEVGPTIGGSGTGAASLPVTNPGAPAIAQSAGRQVGGQQETRAPPQRGNLGASRGSKGQRRAPRPTVDDGEEAVVKGGRPPRRR